MQTDDVEAVRATPNGTLVARRGSEVWAMDGNGDLIYDGRVEKSLGSMFKASMKKSVSIGGLSFNDLSGEQQSVSPLPEAGVLMVFDNTDDEELIRAVDLRTGDDQWTSADYRWSLSDQKMIGDAAFAKLAGELSGENTSVQALELFNRYAQDLVADMPDSRSMLIKVNAGLIRVSARSGDVIWEQNAITGTGIAAVHSIEGTGDLIVVTNQTDLAEWSEDGQLVARLDAETGEVAWSTPYGARSAPDLRGLRILGDAVVLDMDAGAAEAYRLTDGQALFSSAATTRTADRVVNAIGGVSALGGTQTAPAVAAEGTLYVPHTSNLSSAGRPDKTAKAYDLSTGEEIWTAEPVENMHDIRELRVVGGHLVAHVVKGPGKGEHSVVAWDLSDGRQVWSQSFESGTIHLGNDDIHAAVDSTLHVLDHASGERSEQINLGDSEAGSPLYMYATETGYGILRSQGLTVVGEDDVPSTSRLSGPVVTSIRRPTYERFGNRLFVPVSTERVGTDVTEIHVFDAANADRLAVIRNLDHDPDQPAVASNLTYGFRSTTEGTELFVLDADGFVVSYRVPEAGQRRATAR